MQKAIWISIGLLGVAVALGLWGLLSVAPGSPGPLDESNSARPEHTVGLTATGQSSAHDALGRPMPKAVVDHHEHDFKLMDPGADGEHTFVIRNEGDAPLELKAGPTTCKCAVAKLAQRVVDPGGEAEVRVEWTTPQVPNLFFERATILTNDPIDREVRLILKGDVRIQVALDPPVLELERVAPDQETTKTVLVYSQVWDDFTVANVESSIEGLTWQAEPVTRPLPWPRDVKRAYDLRLTLPADLPEGRFAESLRIHVGAPQAPDGQYVHEAPLRGKVLRRLCVYGKGIDLGGVVYIGPVDVGKSAQRKFLMKVRDPQRELPIRKIETTPDFLQVRVTPHESTDQELGLYELEIVVPSDAPRCIYMGSPAGEVRILPDHPRIPELALPVKFAVVATG
jgi:hypothetical protein